ncbi:DUF418 domain-containing protein [Piscinibacter sakaiensis]|uniref:Membrane protein, putative n=1 Tax=Piscinibacter sakaiensis TaxID=1547922 RepID=A0A0K8P117_PISS1|nr:DUF418 domain-containing protein [Piscinibacter sakaiensis]GAP35865.1 membrane protein, putative [Piscinibacter sakaiensis]
MTLAADVPAATPATERLLVLDVVRGVALLGILVMNVPAFTSAPPSPWPWLQSLDHAAALLRDVAFAGKFNSMFSMLFGLGFMLQLERLQQREPGRATRIYLRRLAWLLGLGLLHAAVFWNGDVLHMYALLGFGLLWMRRWPDRALFALMGLCLLGPALSQAVRAWLAAGSPGGGTVAPLADAAYAWSAAEVQAYGHGGFVDAVRETLRGFVAGYTTPHELRVHAGFYAQVLTTMVLGLLIGRHGWLQRLERDPALLERLQRTALVLGLLLGLGYAVAHETSQAAGPSVARALAGSAYVLARLALMAFYVLTLVRLLQSAAWRRRLAPFALAGRMPLTNYLLQTALCSLLFYGWGLGLWDRVGPAAELLIAPALYFGLLLPASRWWLARFEQGPFEWAWRRATYGRAAPPLPAPAK